VGDQERTAVCDELSAQFAVGRLDLTELEHRLNAAITAQTRHDLGLLLGDLPPLEHAPVKNRPPAPQPVASRPSWNALDVLALIVVLGCSLVALLGMLIVLGAGGGSYALVAAAATLTAGLGSAAAVHLVHRSVDRALTTRRPDLSPGAGRRRPPYA
jgi:hypothetical protein